MLRKRGKIKCEIRNKCGIISLRIISCNEEYTVFEDFINSCINENFILPGYINTIDKIELYFENRKIYIESFVEEQKYEKCVKCDKTEKLEKLMLDNSVEREEINQDIETKIFNKSNKNIAKIDNNVEKDMRQILQQEYIKEITIEMQKENERKIQGQQKRLDDYNFYDNYLSELNNLQRLSSKVY